MTFLTLTVPGRVNLIGEHIDYHGLPVLPMAIQRGITIQYKPRADQLIRAASSPSFKLRELRLSPVQEASKTGDWINYLKAATQAAFLCGELTHGIDAEITSNLPSAAGLSSSSALLVGFALALLRSNGLEPKLEQLMKVLPEAEHFVGTRGGGMDHAAVLASREGHALLVHFAPFSATHIRVPEGWAFLIAHSMETAEKSSAAREAFNAIRAYGQSALRRLGFGSYAEAVAAQPPLYSLAPDEQRCALHTITESMRVSCAVHAMRQADARGFGVLLNQSHASLRDCLHVSTPQLDRLVEAALESGALGARLTGAGFGGCAIVFYRAAQREQVRAGLMERFYANQHGFSPDAHLIDARPSNGVLHE